MELEFYYKTKYEKEILEKTAQEEISLKAEKFAANLKDTAIMFAKRNPKAVEGAITGGILGAGSELAMPSRVDVTGQPVTNLAEMGKRGLLGATLGGVGGTLKANVSKRISDLPMPKVAEKEFNKIAGILNTLKAIPALQKSQMAGKAIQGIGNIAGNLGTNDILNTAGKYMAKNPRVGGAVLGAGAGLVGNALSGSDHALGSAAAGAGLGALGGRSLLAGAVKKNPLLGKSFAEGARGEMAAVRAAKAPSTVNATSLQSAPPLSELVTQSGIKIPQQTIPKLRSGLTTPQKPQEINWG